MAAGIVYHDITTSSGVTFSIACWVPDTALPDVGAIAVSQPVAPPNVAAAQVAPTTSAGTLLAGRALRAQVTFKNIGSTVVYIGPATVTAANGMQLNPGESITLKTQTLIQAISIGATGNIAYIDEYY